jgi:hypothetical protein
MRRVRQAKDSLQKLDVQLDRTRRPARRRRPELDATCRLHEVDPYDYLVDVLQRVGQHPAADVAQLTPKLWKQCFGKAPLRSEISRRAP